MNDGRYLLAWPNGGALRFILLFAGLVLGLLHFWPLFSYSLVAMAVMIAIAMFGAALGASLWLGYVVADFVFAPHPARLTYGNVVTRFLHVRLPLLIAYAVLAFALAFVPLAARQLHVQLWNSVGRRTRARVVRYALGAIIAALLVFGWTLVAPLLIRPAITWDHPGVGRFSKYPIEAFEPLQHWGWLLALIAAAAAAGRSRLQEAARERRRFIEPTRPPRALAALANLARRVPSYLSIPLKAALGTFFLAGLARDCVDASILAGIVLLVMVARRGVARTPAILKRARRVPRAARITALGLASFLIGCLTMQGTLESEPGFRPLIYALGASLLVSAVLLPSSATRTIEGRRL